MKSKTKLSTVTLGIDDPHAVICPGHVDQKTFNQANRNEGWSPGGGYKQKDLKYIYMVKEKSKRKGYTHFYKTVKPSHPKAKPYTWAPWD